MVAIDARDCHLDAEPRVFRIQRGIPRLCPDRYRDRLKVVPHRARHQNKRDRIARNRGYGARCEFSVGDLNAMVRRQGSGSGAEDECCAESECFHSNMNQPRAFYSSGAPLFLFDSPSEQTRPAQLAREPSI